MPLKAALVHVLIILNNHKGSVLKEELFYFPIMFSYAPDTQNVSPQSIMLQASRYLKNPRKGVMFLYLHFLTKRYPNLYKSKSSS